MVEWGAWLDVGVATEGLLHAREASERGDFIRDLRDVLRKGQRVTVRVVSVAASGKFLLSCKPPREERPRPSYSRREFTQPRLQFAARVERPVARAPMPAAPMVWDDHFPALPAAAAPKTPPAPKAACATCQRWQPVPTPTLPVMMPVVAAAVSAPTTSTPKPAPTPEPTAQDLTAAAVVLGAPLPPAPLAPRKVLVSTRVNGKDLKLFDMPWKYESPLCHLCAW